ncbi:DUF7210 family protein [Pasteurellaceae bacterium 22721_9_1]
MEQKLAYLVVASTAILHNGKRYEQGNKIELTDDEAENLSLYIELDKSEVEKQAAERKTAEDNAEKARLAAETAAKKAEAKAAKEAAKKAEHNGDDK